MAQPRSDLARFTAIRGKLVIQLNKLRNPQSQDAQSQTGWKTERDVIVGHENDIRELFRLGKRVQNTPAERRGSETVAATQPGTGARSLAGTFFRRVIGDGLAHCRAKIFSILLFLDLDPRTSLWNEFLLTLQLDLDDVPSLCAFSDAKLPLSRETIASFLGHEDAEGFDVAQHQYYPVDFQSRFSEHVERLKGCIESHKVECQLDGDGEPNHTFYPDSTPSEMVERYADYIKKLYPESFKTTLKPPTPSDPSWNCQTYPQLCDAKRKAEDFLEGVRACPKAFSIFMLMNISAESDIWRQFEASCIHSKQTLPILNDDRLPLVYGDAKKVLGTKHFETFFERQFAFCAPVLHEGRQIEFEHHEPYMRLPLCEKKLIKPGGGSSGSVYRVKIHPRHFHSADRVQYLAMKCAPLNRNNANEWENLKLIVEQPLKHDAIMKPRASLVTQNQIYIISNKADCNLDEYMEDDDKMAAGPRDFKDKLRHFSQIVGIAEALEHLHRTLVTPDHLRETVVVYHMDIKAPNVLVTEVGEKLLFQLTDFGISTMKCTTEELKSGRDSLLIRHQTTRPRLGHGNPNSPPEAEDRGHVHSKADIWALGTVLARFTAWLPRGKQSLMEFERTRGTEVNGEVEEREFFERFPETKKSHLSPGVGRFFEELVADTNQATHGKERLLYESTWWLLKEKLLVCDEDLRADISKVPKILRQILQSVPLEEIKQSDAQGVSQRVGPTPAQQTAASIQSPRPQFQSPNDTAVPTTVDSHVTRNRGTRPSVNSFRHEAVDDMSPGPRLSSETARTAPEVPAPRQWSQSREANPLPRLTSATTDPQRPQSSRFKVREFLKTKPKRGKTVPLNGTLIRRPSEQETLVLAIKEGNDQTFRQALHTIPSSDLDGHVEECTPLEHAVQNGRLDMVGELLVNGANIHIINNTAGTLLHRAAEAGMVEMMELLLSSGIKVNATDSKRRTALSKVSQKHPANFHGVLECFLRHKDVDIETRDDNNATPLIRAAYYGDVRVVIMLLDVGANPKVADNDGYTPLHRAIRFESTITEALLNANEDGTLVHMKTKKGRTALHLCADLASTEALANAKILLENNTEVNAPDFANETPLDLASDKNVTPEHSNMVKLLIENGASITDTIKNDPKRRDFKAIRNAMDAVKGPYRQSSYPR